MKTISNTTHRPLRIALRGGRVLHLGPKATGYIGDDDAERPSVRRLIQDKQVVVRDDATPDEIRDMPNAPRKIARASPHQRTFNPIGGRTARGRREG